MYSIIALKTVFFERENPVNGSSVIFSSHLFFTSRLNLVLDSAYTACIVTPAIGIGTGTVVSIVSLSALYSNSIVVVIS